MKILLLISIIALTSFNSFAQRKKRECESKPTSDQSKTFPECYMEDFRKEVRSNPFVSKALQADKPVFWRIRYKGKVIHSAWLSQKPAPGVRGARVVDFEVRGELEGNLGGFGLSTTTGSVGDENFTADPDALCDAPKKRMVVPPLSIEEMNVITAKLRGIKAVMPEPKITVLSGPPLKPIAELKPKPEPAKEVDLSKDIFGRITGDRIAFIIDASGSFNKFQPKVISSVGKSVSELKENQEFTIVFLTDKNIYLNSGKLLNATAENKEVALKFLQTPLPSSGSEPMPAAIKRIDQENGKIDRIYFFGDGDSSYEKNSIDQLGLHDDDVVKVIKEYGVPVTARSGYEGTQGPDIDDDVEKHLVQLQRWVDVSNGIIINKKLD